LRRIVPVPLQEEQTSLLSKKIRASHAQDQEEKKEARRQIDAYNQKHGEDKFREICASVQKEHDAQVKEGWRKSKPRQTEQDWLDNNPLPEQTRNSAFKRDSAGNLWETYEQHAPQYEDETVYNFKVRQIHKTAPTPHDQLSWTACYQDGCKIHQADKEGAGWVPKISKKSKHQVWDDRNYGHQYTSWRACRDDYCTSHYDTKTKKGQWEAPNDYADVLEQRDVEERQQEEARNRRRFPERFDGSHIKVFDKESSEEEGGVCMKWIPAPTLSKN
jgi:hypothetical protein